MTKGLGIKFMAKSTKHLEKLKRRKRKEKNIDLQYLANEYGMNLNMKTFIKV